MSNAAFNREQEAIDPERLEKAKKGFLSVPKSFTIRGGKVTGAEQFEQRLRRAIAAYQANGDI